MSEKAELLGFNAKDAFDASQLLETTERSKALLAIKDELIKRKDEVFAANELDLKEAALLVEQGKLSAPSLRRLGLNNDVKFNGIIKSLEEIAELDDPNNKISYAVELDKELELYRVACPIGVLLVIFESRPEVVINVAALSIKSGNAAILKGGKESKNTSFILNNVIQTALAERTQLKPHLIQTINTREEVSSLLHLDKYIDLVVPRGGKALVTSIKENSKIPVMGHADGICSVFVDESADLEKAVRVVVDSKTDYPSVCNATETLLVHQSQLGNFNTIAEALLTNKNPVTMHLDEKSFAALSDSIKQQYSQQLVKSTDEDYETEWLDYEISVKVVDSINEAILHVNTHGSHHTDCIVTENDTNKNTWMKGVDSAGCYVNVSTRFADGFRYGFGAEFGVATGKTHARGPVGLEGLVIYKYILRSIADKGHIVGEYGSGGKSFSHTPIKDDRQPWY
ncbi:gamma-glutamyl phosphate reductase [Wallemia mellicola]|nr:gamma-glutamyl phosphate reductase [Wallemia mellicola]